MINVPTLYGIGLNHQVYYILWTPCTCKTHERLKGNKHWQYYKHNVTDKNVIFLWNATTYKHVILLQRYANWHYTELSKRLLVHVYNVTFYLRLRPLLCTPPNGFPNVASWGIFNVCDIKLFVVVVLRGQHVIIQYTLPTAKSMTPHYGHNNTRFHNTAT